MTHAKKPSVMKATEVLLRNRDNQKSQGFAPDHAERLLAYPGTRWEKVAEGEEPAPKGKKALPQVDTTGQPDAV